MGVRGVEGLLLLDGGVLSALVLLADRFRNGAPCGSQLTDPTRDKRVVVVVIGWQMLLLSMALLLSRW